MVKLTVEDIQKSTGANLISGDKGALIAGVSTDSRELKEGHLFIAIKGERFDGHDFVDQAVRLGAGAVLISEEVSVEGNISVLKVPDTIKAFGELSRFVRSGFKKPVIAVTGSVGKTSTASMIRCALGIGKKVLSPEKNYNNHIGLPKTLMNLDNSYDYVVLEMGMSGFGEIAYLSDIAKPDISVITNIGISHIGKLGSKQNILKAKLEIIHGMNHQSGLLLMNGDDGLLKGMKDYLPIRNAYFGTEEGNDYTAFNIQKHKNGKPGYLIRLNNKEYEIRLNAPGYHMIYNSLAALAVANELGVPPVLAIEGLSRFTPKPQRMDIIRTEYGIMINDTYNASPESMDAALSVLGDIADGRRKVAVLGDMLEMGGYAEEAHRQLGASCTEHGIDLLIVLGEYNSYVAEGAVKAGLHAGNVYLCDRSDQLQSLLILLVKDADAILVKGSRAMKMEESVQTISTMWQNNGLCLVSEENSKGDN